jgi:gas vesicle protein
VADERHDAAFVVGAVIGGLAAAAVTLFRAPQSGARTRAQLAERIGPPVATARQRARTTARAAQGTSQRVSTVVVGSTGAVRARLGRGTDRPSTTTIIGPSAAPTGSRGGLVTESSPRAAAPLGGAPAPLTEEARRALDLDPVVRTGEAGRPEGQQSGELPSAAAAAAALSHAAPAVPAAGDQPSVMGKVDVVIDGPRPANASPDRSPPSGVAESP